MQGSILAFHEGGAAAECRDESASLLIAVRPGAADILRPLAEALGQRVLGVVPLADLAVRMADTIALDTLLVDLRGLAADGEGFAAVARADRERRALGGCAMIVLFDMAAIDPVAGALDGVDHVLLCEPSQAEIVAALAVAGLRGGGEAIRHLHDIARDSDAARIDMLSKEVRRLAETIERLAAPDHGLPEAGTRLGDRRRGFREMRAVEDLASDGPAPSHAEIRTLIRARRLRDRFLPAALFADPAWDMMLDLLAARLSGKRVSVSSLCIAAAVPPTTALCWIRQLTDRGIFARIDDPVDGRRVFIELTDEAAAGLIGWARAVRSQGGVLAAP